MAFQIDRRELLTGAAAVLMAAVPECSRAGEPLEHLTLVVPAAPGGGWDQTAHAMERTLKQASLSRHTNVYNYDGQRGLTGLGKFATEAAGRTDSLMVAGLVMVSTIASTKSAVTLADLKPLARLAADFQVVVVPSGSKLQSMADLGVALTSDVASLAWTGGPPGGTDHILAGLIGRAVGIDLSQLRYNPATDGAPIQAALLEGRADIGIGGSRDFSDDLASGRLRALGISARSRRPGLDLPTIKEQGFDVELVNWRGVFAPPRIDDGAFKTLGAVIEAMAKSLAWHDEVARRGWLDLYQPAEAFGRFVANESTRIGEVLRRLGVA